MRRATVTIPDDLENELNVYLAEQEPRPSLTGLVQAALRRFLAEKRQERRLAERQHQPPGRPLRISPALQGSGSEDVSTDHDRYLTEDGE